MIKNYIEKSNFQDTGFSYTLSLINGKYKMIILYCLMEFEIVRYNELKRYIGVISHKTLSLSEKGKSLMKILDQLCVWGEQNKEK